jgi:hypothetical protein
MTADPASLNVAVTITGLHPDEAAAVFANLPAGSTSTVHVVKPALGPKRYQIDVGDLSIQGAKDVTTALHLSVQRATEGDQP